MTLTTLYNGDDGPDIGITATGSFTNKEVQTYAGDDSYGLSGDFVGGLIDLGDDSDLLGVTDFATQPGLFANSTVYGGSGEDNLVFFVSRVFNNTVDLGDGNDRLFLNGYPLPLSLIFPGLGTPATSASIDNNVFLGGEGTDAIIIDNTVLTFNENFVDLGDNDNSSLGAFADFLIDGLIAGEDFNDLIDQGPVVEYVYCAATEVDSSTFRGGQGEDILFFESFSGSPDSLDGDDLPLTTSLVNGNSGDDIIGIARNFAAQTSVLGGRGNDNILLLSETFLSSQVNGNLGADIITLGAIDAQAATFYGGQGDDVMDIGSAVIKGSLLSGDLGNDKINFGALVSVQNTLSGGQGNDEIDDFSYAISGQGNLLLGGDGNDTLRQAANIFATISNGAGNGVADFAATFIGGIGADRMTGDLNTQGFAPKQLNVAGTDVLGASSDTFQFSFGDTVVNAFGVGRDVITDFDSNASRYLINGTPAFNLPVNPVLDFASPNPLALPPLPLLEDRERDVIDLLNKKITVGTPTNLNTSPYVGESVSTNGLVRGVGSMTRFLQIASTIGEGGALLWEETGSLGPSPRSQLFISDGVAGLTGGDLLIQLDQVAGFTNSSTAGFLITNGNITDIRLA